VNDARVEGGAGFDEGRFVLVNVFFVGQGVYGESSFFVKAF